MKTKTYFQHNFLKDVLLTQFTRIEIRHYIYESGLSRHPVIPIPSHTWSLTDSHTNTNAHAYKYTNTRWYTVTRLKHKF